MEENPETVETAPVEPGDSHMPGSDEPVEPDTI